MSFIPIIDPSSNVVDSFGFEPPPVSSRIAGFINAFQDTIRSSPLGMASYQVGKMVNNSLGHGPFLSAKQIQEQYPNIAHKYPKGGNLHDVLFDSNVKAAHDEAMATISSMPPGILSTAGAFGASMLGMILSPTSIVGGSLVSNLGKVLEEKIAGKYLTTKLLTATPIKFGLGALENIAALSPFIASEEEFYKAMGEPAPPIWANIIMGGIAGGSLHTLFGLRNMFHPKTMETALDTANKQVQAGKEIKVDPLLKQAQYEASKEWTETTEEINKKVADAEEKLPTLPPEKQQELQQQIDDTKLYGDMLADQPTSVTPEEAEDAAQQNMSWESNIDSNPSHFEDSEKLTNASDSVVDEYLGGINERLDNLEKNGLLSDTAKEVIEEGKKENKDNISVAAALKNYMNCILGKGE